MFYLHNTCYEYTIDPFGYSRYERSGKRVGIPTVLEYCKKEASTLIGTIDQDMDQKDFFKIFRDRYHSDTFGSKIKIV